MACNRSFWRWVLPVVVGAIGAITLPRHGNAPEAGSSQTCLTTTNRSLSGGNRLALALENNSTADAALPSTNEHTDRLSNTAGDGEWTQWLTSRTNESAAFAGGLGKAFCSCCVVRDGAGNVPAPPSPPDVIISDSTLYGVSTGGASQGEDGTVFKSVTEGTGFTVLTNLT